LEPQFSNEEVRDLVTLRRYPAPTDLYLESLRTTIRASRPRPFDPAADHCAKWLADHKVLNLFDKPLGVTEAFEIFQSYDMRTKVEAMLLGNVAPENIAQILAKHTGKILDATTIPYFRHYFWNIDVMSMDDWRSFLEDYDPGDLLWGVYIAKDSNVALARIGEEVDLSPDDFMLELLQESMVRMKSLSKGMDNPVATQAARVWSNIAFRSFELHTKQSTGLNQAVELLQTLVISSQSEPVGSVLDMQRSKNVFLLQEADGDEEDE